MGRIRLTSEEKEKLLQGIDEAEALRIPGGAYGGGRPLSVEGVSGRRSILRTEKTTRARDYLLNNFNMIQNIIYKGTANTKEEAEALALSLLKPFMQEKGIYKTITREYMDGKQTVRLADAEDDSIAPPIVFISDFGGEGKVYKLYLVFDWDRLPFYYKYRNPVIASLLPLFAPTIKPAEALPVEVVLTAEGEKKLRKAVYGWEEDTVLQRNIRRAQEETEESMRIYTLFDSFGELSSQEIKEGLEAGDYEGGIVDAEIVLNSLTGKTYRTETAYLKDLAAWAGAEAVEKYKTKILEDYRMYKTVRFMDYLHYMLLYTEDFSYVEAHYQEYASAVGYKEEYAPVSHIGEGTVLEAALHEYLQDYLDGRSFFEGLTEERVREYLNVPAPTYRRLTTLDFSEI